MKHDDYSKGGKEHNASSFSLSTSKSLSFSVSRMNAKESFVENLQKKSREKSA
jgi:hypothetical protein